MVYGSAFTPTGGASDMRRSATILDDSKQSSPRPLEPTERGTFGGTTLTTSMGTVYTIPPSSAMHTLTIASSAHQQQQEKRRAKTNSERGKAFRAKRRNYEAELHTMVNALRNEVNDLDMLRHIRQEKSVNLRHSMNGSLVRLVQEYFNMFSCGLPSAQSAGHKRMLTDGYEQNMHMKQEAFLKFAMAPEMVFDEGVGPMALLEQWRRYTMYHASLSVKVVKVEMIDTEDTPVVAVTSDLCARFSRETFKNVFPHCQDNEELVNKFLGKEVVYRGVNHLHFDANGQIQVYNSDVGFMDALIAAGATIKDLAALMPGALIKQSMLGVEPEESPVSSPSRFEEVEPEPMERARDPLQLDFILS